MFVCWFADDDELVPTGNRPECWEARENSLSPPGFACAAAGLSEESLPVSWGLSWRCCACEGVEVPLLGTDEPGVTGALPTRSGSTWVSVTDVEWAAALADEKVERWSCATRNRHTEQRDG